MKKSVLSVVSVFFVVAAAVAALSYNQNIVAIFGSGNPNTGWTVDESGGVKLALRAKNREDANTFNISGVYPEPVGVVAPNNNRAKWNWEFSIDSGTVPLNTYEYYLNIDMDRSTGKSFLVVNALTGFTDDSYGTGSTANGQGLEGTAATYAGSMTIVQQSQNIAFWGLISEAVLDSTYDYELYAVAAGAGPSGARIATTAIKVVVGAGGPLPPDDDGDGVPNSVDQCPGTIAGHAVDVNGCSVQDLVNKCAIENANDHGEYVSCVVELANRLFKVGTIDKDRRKLMINAAAQSSVGK